MRHKQGFHLGRILLLDRSIGCLGGLVGSWLGLGHIVAQMSSLCSLLLRTLTARAVHDDPLERIRDVVQCWPHLQRQQAA